MSEQNQLPFMPAGWVEPTIDSFCEITQGQSPPSSTYNTEGRGLPFFQGKAEFGDLYPTVEKWCVEPSKVAEEGDILISIRAPVGPTNLAPTKVAIGRGLAAIHPLGGIGSKYVLYALRNTEEELAAQGTGSTFAAISGDILRNHKLPLAPLTEQQRIVNEIEKQFSRLDAAVEMMQRVERNLERLRAATLEAAAEGQLVPNEAELARAEGSNYEPADMLLLRILRERRAKWEAYQVAKMKEQGKTPKDDKWKLAYSEPASPRNTESSNLPPGWCWATIEQLLRSEDSLSYGILKPGNYDPNGVPMLRVLDIGDGKLNETDIFKVSKELSDEFKRTILEPKDILLSVMATIGRCMVVPDSLAGANVNRALAVLKLTSLVSSNYISIVLRSPRVQSLFQQNKIGSAQPRINLGDLRLYEIPIPPLAEQSRIVSEVERLISVIEELKTLITNALRRAAILRQKILRDAFAGKLIPQDPADEPASELLKKVRAERAKHEAERQTAHKGGKTKMERKGKQPASKRRDILEVLKEINKPIKPEDLFRDAGYKSEEIEAFYADLKLAYAAGAFDEEKKSNGNVYLRARP